MLAGRMPRVIHPRKRCLMTMSRTCQAGAAATLYPSDAVIGMVSSRYPNGVPKPSFNATSGL
jgi:hypothetical protein